MNKSIITIVTCVLLIFSLVAEAQPGAEIEVNKPKKYENRKLGSEKTGSKKFTIPRKIYQNTVTHYNYYFNANNRLNDLVTAAKTSYKDDYSKLLSFYNYTLNATAQNKTELDSIIYKCTAGILLHDLRNSWIDNMYLLLAKAYFFRNDLDSAGLTLQYLNFAYAPKEEGGYNIPIGSNASNDKGEFSIATREKNSIWTKLTSRPPSRNESFIWQVRNHIEKDELPEAAGIIEILKNDPNFPSRLQNQLYEMQSYWFYKQQAYDSASHYLSKALSEATDSQEKARWEYLIAQMYQLAGKHEEAINFYKHSIAHTTDPVMDVYARLNSIKIQRSDNKDYLQENIDALQKMAGRDKYENYRDIIYYAAATIELERKNYNAAQYDLLNSVKFNQDNAEQRTQSFLLLGDLNYTRRAYPESYNFYDSLDINLLRDEDRARIEFRKPPLKTISENTQTIFSQDSLQALAQLSADKRDAIINKQVKILRKAQGLKDEEEETPNFNPAVKKVPDLFSEEGKSNDFYFYNPAQKARGFSEFKARWGERPNVDNWRRRSAINKLTQAVAETDDVTDSPVEDEQSKTTEASYEGLLANIPLTEEKLEESNNAIMDALFSLGYNFSSKLEEYPSAIHAYEELLRRFPNTSYKDEALFNLVYAYQKTGNIAKANELKNQLITSSPESNYAKLLQNPALAKNDDQQKKAATKKYEDIYNLFIEGKFQQAKNEKQVADSIYGNSYWTPQLLYIESIYYIKQQDDSSAIKVLTDLATMHGESPIAERAQTMIDVLRRRKEIESYLANLNVTRTEDAPVRTVDQPVVVTPVVDEPEEEEPEKIVPKLDVPATVKTKQDQAVATAPKIKEKSGGIKLNTPTVKKDSVVISKDTVADTEVPVVISKDTIAKTEVPVVISKDTIAKTEVPVVISKDTIAKTEVPVVISKDTIAKTEVPVVRNPTIDTVQKVKDTVVTPSAPVIVKNFTFVATDPHYVVILLDKVDKVYASEARNAFNRYNREKFYNQRIDINASTLDERFQLILQGPFTNAAAAADYLDIVKPIATTRIIPWLNADKYSFIIISNANLDILKSYKDLDAYKQLFQKAFPGKF